MIGVKYVSLYGAIGYFTAAKRYMKALAKLGVPLTWTPMVPHMRFRNKLVPFEGDSVGDADLDPYCNKSLDYDVVLLHIPPDYYPYWKARAPGKRMVGYAAWETDRLPRRWPALLNISDSLMVPCRWNRETFIRCGVKKPVEVVPHIVPEEPLENRVEIPGVPSDAFVFYTIETWSARKAVQDTIDSYLSAFSSFDRAFLVVKTSKRAYSENYLRRLGRIKPYLGPFKVLFQKPAFLRGKNEARSLASAAKAQYHSPARTILITGDIGENEIAAIHRRGDCYVSLTRSEAWGLGPFDAASYGKPVIVTGYGGQLDYLETKLSFLVDYRLSPARDFENCRNFGGQSWAMPDKAHASRLMKNILRNPMEARFKGATLGKMIRKKYNRETVCEKLLNALGI